MGKMSQFWQFCDFQEVAKVHRSQQPLRRGPLYLAKIFRNVCSFRPLFQTCDILCYSDGIELESAEVCEKSPNDLHMYGDTDRPL